MNIELLTAVADAVTLAAKELVPGDGTEVLAAMAANDERVLARLRPALTGLVPDAGWLDEEFASAALPPGRWWLADPADGNVNLVHGLPEVTVAVTLVEDNIPRLTVVHAPVSGRTWTALAGHGAWQDGQPVHVSAKTALAVAMGATTQPVHGAGQAAAAGQAYAALAGAGVVVRAGVPSTQHLAQVASGVLDLFWRVGADRVESAAGALLVAEAGGVVTDLGGRPWSLGADSLLAAAPGVHAAALAVLAEVGR
ncbi:myo-inositol-1(or 4)-monophosphatase [Crossiella equi]|uniref:Myo-inositol-1(Or 4)-monophosphatase n=1 Tax=Crossiella equi TaxID=130796 RepID=A0ABS5A407_9PSEU|nr:inositol monophosphatase family protein [Crossiella equi]MBP2471308.1 myo-inositol-1(or 4)-monophosphatase [Crossiella equi]